MSAGASRTDIEAEVYANQNRQRADEAFRHALGCPAPGRFADESVVAHRIRQLSALTQFSPNWKTSTPESLREMHRANALHIVEAEVFADAVEYGKRSTGPLRVIETPDDAGRPVRRFYGDADACWGQFKLPVRCVARFNCAGGDLR